MHATHDTRRTTAEQSEIEPNATRISSHARLRGMMRLGVIDEVGEYIRELLRKATPVEDSRFPACRAYRYGGVTIVVDDTDDVVKTVVKEVER